MNYLDVQGTEAYLARFDNGNDLFWNRDGYKVWRNRQLFL